MGIERKFDILSNLRMAGIPFEECPPDIQQLRGTSYCAFYNTHFYRKREECLYY